LRQHNPNLAIIVLSGYPAASSGELCLSLGADLYIEKGLPIKDLHRLVIETVNSRAKIAKETIINRANYAE
jgi:DNA-binding NarL/FixJ family response regulator